MHSKKYIGMDVHQATISVAVRDSSGKLIMESIIETKAATILEFIRGLDGSLSVTFEEGTGASWLYDLLKPHVAELIVCDPRKNALLKGGNKNDKVDARKLSELLRAGLLSPVYHGERSVRTLKELARSYLTLTKDLTRVMNFHAPAETCMRRPTATNGWRNCQRLASADEPIGSTNNLMTSDHCGRKPGKSC